MNVAEVKALLNSSWHIEERLKTEYMTIQRLRTAASKSTPSYSQSPGGGGNGQKIENCVLSIVEMERRSEETIKRLLETKAKIHCMIEQLTDLRLKTLLQKRYLNYEKWENIAVDMHCSYRRVHQLHSKALLHLARIS